MQNKHQLFFSFWCPNFWGGGEEGVDLVGKKSQVFPKILFEGFPIVYIQCDFTQCVILRTMLNLHTMCLKYMWNFDSPKFTSIYLVLPLFISIYVNLPQFAPIYLGVPQFKSTYLDFKSFYLSLPQSTMIYHGFTLIYLHSPPLTSIYLILT